MHALAAVLPISLAALGCSAPAKPAVESTEPVGTLAPAHSNDCPNVLWPWTGEAFPACAPPPYPSLPLCAGTGVVCGRPCAEHSSGYSGRESYDFLSTFTYDPRGRMLTRTTNGELGIECTYEGDRLAKCRFGDAEASVERDRDGRIIALTDHGERKPVTYTDGRVTAVGSHVITYDERGWIARDGDKVVEHNANGWVTTIGSGDGAITYEYDHDALVHTKGPGPANSSFSYDGSGRLARIGRGGLETGGGITYDYACE